MLGRLGPFAAVGIYSAAYRAIDAAFIPVRSLLFASYASFFQQGALGIGATLVLARRLLVPSVVYCLTGVRNLGCRGAASSSSAGQRLR